MKHGLISLDYNNRTCEVIAVYEPDSEYDIHEIIAYVEDMSEGKSTHIKIYEHWSLMHDITRNKTAGWTDVVPSAT